MRTTLTIDDDIAAALERLRRSHDASLEDLINEALRRGLREMATSAKRNKPFRTQSVDLGSPLLANVDNIAKILVRIEGKSYK
jgi:hypothetical protein